MGDTTNEQMLESLLHQKQASERELGMIRGQLVAAEHHDRLLGDAVTALRALLHVNATREPQLTEKVLYTVDRSSSRKQLDDDELAVALANELAHSSPREDMQRRTPSTEWVTQVVLDARRPLRREEVLAAVADRYGPQEGWTDPQSTIGVALARAAKSGAIQRTGRGMYAPPSWKEPADDNLTVVIQ